MGLWGSVDRFYKSSSDHEDRHHLLCLCLPTPFHFWLNGWTRGWIDRLTDAMKGTRVLLSLFVATLMGDFLSSDTNEG